MHGKNLLFIGTGVGKIMIPPIIESFCVCPPSYYHSLFMLISDHSLSSILISKLRNWQALSGCSISFFYLSLRNIVKVVVVVRIVYFFHNRKNPKYLLNHNAIMSKYIGGEVGFSEINHHISLFTFSNKLTTLFRARSNTSVSSELLGNLLGMLRLFPQGLNGT